MPIPLGFLSTAGGVAGSFDWLETTTLASAVSSVTISGLDAYSDYKHLQIRALLRSTDGTAGLYDGLIRINGDSATNYSYGLLIGANGGILSGTRATATTFIGLLDYIPASTGSTEEFAPAVIDILEFNSTTKNKVARFNYGAHFGTTSTTEAKSVLGSGMWVNTTAATSITIGSISANLAANSKIALYGIKA